MVYSMNQIITHSYPKTDNLQKQNYTANISQAPTRVNIKSSVFSRPMVEQVNRRPAGCSSCGK